MFDHNNIFGTLTSGITAFNLAVGDLLSRLIFSITVGVITWSITSSVSYFLKYKYKK